MSRNHAESLEPRHGHLRINPTLDHEAASAYRSEARFALTKGGISTEGVPGGWVDAKGGLNFGPNTVEGRRNAIGLRDAELDRARKSVTDRGHDAAKADRILGAATKIDDYMKSIGRGITAKDLRETIDGKGGQPHQMPDEQRDAARFLLKTWDDPAMRTIRGESDKLDPKDKFVQKRAEKLGHDAQEAIGEVQRGEQAKAKAHEGLTAKDGILDAGKIKKGDGPDLVAARLFKEMYGHSALSGQDWKQVRNIGRALVKTMHHTGKVFRVGEGLTAENFPDFLKNLEGTAI